MTVVRSDKSVSENGILILKQLRTIRLSGLALLGPHPGARSAVGAGSTLEHLLGYPPGHSLKERHGAHVLLDPPTAGSSIRVSAYWTVWIGGVVGVCGNIN